MLNTASHMKAALLLILFGSLGVLLALSSYSYGARELLVCWLFFGLLLVSISPVILGAVLAYYAARRIIRWAWMLSRVTPKPTLDLSPFPSVQIREPTGQPAGPDCNVPQAGAEVAL